MPTGKYVHKKEDDTKRAEGVRRFYDNRNAKMSHKICNKCGVEKPLSEFVIRQEKSWYTRKGETERSPHKRISSYCKPCDKARLKEIGSRPESKEKSRAWRLKRDYGITLEDYKDMFERQEGVCAVCLNPSPHTRLLAVDHDHETGKLRALLCNACNLTLGGASDNPELLRALADYIERYR